MNTSSSPSNSINDQTVQRVQPVDGCVPLGLDEPNTVWDNGARFVNIPGAPKGLSGRVVALHLTEQDAWAYRDRFREFMTDLDRDPKEYLFIEVIALCMKHGATWIILDGQGREVCR